MEERERGRDEGKEEGGKERESVEESSAKLNFFFFFEAFPHAHGCMFPHCENAFIRLVLLRSVSASVSVHVVARSQKAGSSAWPHQG